MESVMAQAVTDGQPGVIIDQKEQERLLEETSNDLSG